MLVKSLVTLGLAACCSALNLTNLKAFALSSSILSTEDGKLYGLLYSDEQPWSKLIQAEDSLEDSVLVEDPETTIALLAGQGFDYNDSEDYVDSFGGFFSSVPTSSYISYIENGLASVEAKRDSTVDNYFVFQTKKDCQTGNCRASSHCGGGSCPGCVSFDDKWGHCGEGGPF